MGLLDSLGIMVGRGRVSGWRKGKAGVQMQKLMALADGRKRYFLLAIFALQALVNEFTDQGGNITQFIKVFLSIVGWSPDDALVSSAVVAQLVAAVMLIVDGIRKDREKRAAAEAAKVLAEVNQAR